MTASEFKTVTEFEGSLHPGQAVYVKWSAGSAGHYKGEAVVKKINAKSVRVTLTKPVETARWGNYPQGHEIVVPLVANIVRWTYFNRVEPMNGYSVEA